MTETVLFSVRWRNAFMDHGPVKRNGTLRGILQVIARHMDDETGQCHRSHETIAREAGFSPDTVQRQLSKAFKSQALNGWLTREKKATKAGHWFYVYQGYIPAWAQDPHDGESGSYTTIDRRTREGDGPFRNRLSVYEKSAYIREHGIDNYLGLPWDYDHADRPYREKCVTEDDLYP